MVLGKCYLKKKLFDLAEKEFKRVILFDPKYIAAHKYYGDLMREVGWDNTCEMSYRKILSIDPLDRNAREMLETLQRSKPNEQEVVTPGHASIIEDTVPTYKSSDDEQAEEPKTKTVPINLDDDLFADVSDDEKDQVETMSAKSEPDKADENDEQVITTILEDIFDDEQEKQARETEQSAAPDDDLDFEISKRPTAQPDSRSENDEDVGFDAQPRSDIQGDDDAFGLNAESEAPSKKADKDSPASESQQDDPFAGMFDQFEEETIELDEMTEMGAQSRDRPKASAESEMDFAAEEEPAASKDDDAENYFDSLDNDADDFFEQIGTSDAEADEQSQPAEPAPPAREAPAGEAPSQIEPEPESANSNGEQPSFEESTGFEREKIVTPTLGEIYAAQGQYAKAINVFELLLKKEPSNANYQKKVSFLKKKMEESQNV